MKNYLKMYLTQAMIGLIILLIVSYFYDKKIDLIWYGTGVLIGFINTDIRNYFLKKLNHENNSCDHSK